MVVVDTRDHILSTFDRALSMYADEQFARQGIDVIHNSRVRCWLVLRWETRSKSPYLTQKWPAVCTLCHDETQSGCGQQLTSSGVAKAAVPAVSRRCKRF